MTSSTRFTVASSLVSSVLAVCLLSTCFATSAHASSQFLLIMNDLEAVPIRLLGMDGRLIHYVDPASDQRHARPLTECIAILRDPPPAHPSGSAARGEQGLLRLVDGRQFPGELATPSHAPPRAERAGTSGESFAWHSNWLGRTEVLLSDIDWIVFRATAAGRFDPPPPGRADVVVLVNGDTLTGFITSMRQKVLLEVDGDDQTSVLEIPIDRVAAVNMVSTAEAGERARRRAWLADGTVLNVERIEIDEAGVSRLIGTEFSSGARVDLRHLAAVLLTPGRMVPLASLPPREVSGPETRYVVPDPEVIESDALLGLSPLKLHGPLRVVYELPEGATRFAAEAVLPEASRRWGDFELVIRSGENEDREVFRERLNASRPRVSINVEVTGEALSLEIISGDRGPIQNHVILDRAMFLLP